MTDPARFNQIAPHLREAFGHHQAGRLPQAERAYRRVLAIDPSQFDACQMFAVLQAQRGQYEDARELLQRALGANPQSADAHVNLGRVLKELGRTDEALAALDRAVALDARHALGWSNRGALLRETGRPAEALASLDRALALAPSHPDFVYNRGRALLDLWRPAEAMACFDRVLATAPVAAAFSGRGAALTRLHRHGEALASYDRALALDPDDADARAARGSLRVMHGRLGDAIADLSQVLRLKPDAALVGGNLFDARTQLCDWTGWHDARAALIAGVRAGKLACEPMTLLAAGAGAEDQLRCARLYVAESCPPVAADRPSPPASEKIRLAYVSSDFREHPVAVLSAALYEHHDRARFEVTAISLSPDEPTPMRRRLAGAFDRFVTADQRSEAEIAATMRTLGIDIAIDLNGHTRGARPGLFAHRPAPVQAAYLGYAGTTGAPWMDYIIADRVVIPEGEQRHYSEHVVYLPDTFQANDPGRTISEAPQRRADHGLPASGFVFCSFNAAQKIAPEIFDVWMRLLRAVDGSVLWLSAASDAVRGNLVREAAARGVAAQRLAFAPRVPAAEDHLARYRLADVFLDTPHYNAHATAADALWAGLPIVTLAGGAYAGRVAASLLTAVGLTEFITETLVDYEALALRLAREPALAAAAKRRLAEQRLASPLFDIARFTRALEAAFVKMHDRRLRGLPPDGFAVGQQPAA